MRGLIFAIALLSIAALPGLDQAEAQRNESPSGDRFEKHREMKQEEGADRRKTMRKRREGHWERLEQLRKKNQQDVQDLKEREKDRREYPQQLRKENPEKFKEFMENHPHVKERMERRREERRDRREDIRNRKRDRTPPPRPRR